MISWWKRLLERIAESNKKQYGNKKLDCCDLNKQK
ncbi:MULTISPECIES: LDCC motif putative metal-binding protein [Proteiniclasticum]|nr:MULTISPECIES: LDCC motif putative metal-binding protein [Proteiniclasticum]